VPWRYHARQAWWRWAYGRKVWRGLPSWRQDGQERHTFSLCCAAPLHGRSITILWRACRAGACAALPPGALLSERRALLARRTASCCQPRWLRQRPAYRRCDVTPLPLCLRPGTTRLRWRYAVARTLGLQPALVRCMRPAYRLHPYIQAALSPARLQPLAALPLLRRLFALSACAGWLRHNTLVAARRGLALFVGCCRRRRGAARRT